MGSTDVGQDKGVALAGGGRFEEGAGHLLFEGWAQRLPLEGSDLDRQVVGVT